MSAYQKTLLALCCLVLCTAAVPVAATPTQEADTSGPNVTVEAPDRAVYNATSTFEVAVTNATGAVSVEWTFPDGSTATTQQASYRFQQTGNVTVTVAVTDDTGTTTRTLDYEVFRYTSGRGDSQALPVLGMLGISVAFMGFVVALYFKVLPWFYRNI
ncbi:PKD domain-containing protein [Haloarchaeobius litoreus]|uniref:PKD domain-containing protein n=1 Tax=Haloarchaeobius litoreus TaxID=755306 RepID=A0ABD6DK10_9EURY|nr:PKD domain-containing protein [Haloarchaeobius litoreus]